jgi:hypothetical protein
MRPRRSQIHYPGLLCDEVDVGTLVHRTLIGVPADNVRSTGAAGELAGRS